MDANIEALKQAHKDAKAVEREAVKVMLAARSRTREAFRALNAARPPRPPRVKDPEADNPFAPSPPREEARVSTYPKAVDPARVGTYSPLAGAGGGLVFDEVLEYRVWFKQNGESTYRAFATFEEAEAFSKRDLHRIEPPLALVLQREHVDEPEPGKLSLVRQPRVAEWQVAWLDDASRRTPENLRRILGDAHAAA